MNYDILVTGASVTGPALAWWLARAGHRVTVVERAPEFREGGQNVDVRGLGREVLRRMEIEEAVRERGTGEQGIRFVDAEDRVRAEFAQEDFGTDGPTAELEILRGDIARILYEKSRERVEYVFGDSVAALRQEGADSGDGGVEVSFESGEQRRFDLVLAAEGIGSRTRHLLFGDAAKRVPYDLYMAYFTIPTGDGDGAFARWYNAPGGRSIFLRPDRKGTTRVVLTLQRAPCGYEELPYEEQRHVFGELFADAGWEAPRVVGGLVEADDFYFEMIGQIRLDRWSQGRVALVGDAAWAPGPISGMGTTLGLVGAYVLAGELSRASSPASAFAAYERIMRPYVDKAQDVPKFGPKLAQPQTRLGIALQRFALGAATKPVLRDLVGKLFAPDEDGFELPSYFAAQD
ncbi:FAD-dependent monooxygenase [Haliangium ochraceum]|uniref:Monooxygenase FAD-binding protein n=1 Tax=Haliangium ochraceum (strain DSM 14365 / JCM 11303 / SMP-2) TaxID=502025 RepID=D0LTE6_HALO1|nr:FAD-dependent monooxygenase [Haliangium ochraceum]ACY13841.1 monooxygenase FAD-binding protein [Haliangium ochraceum DSM 14365]